MSAVVLPPDAASFAVIACSDARMLPAACCALLSAHRHLHGVAARLLLLAVDIDDRQAGDIELFSRRHAVNIEVLRYTSPSFEGQAFGRWPTSAVARLYMDAHVPAEISRLLYIDADTVVASALDALFRIDLKGHMVAAVDDYVMAFPAKVKRRQAQIGMRDDGRYFNSGVLLLDWSKMSERNLLKSAREVFGADSNSYDCPDQDALNVVADRDWLVLDPRWNAQTGILPFVGDPGIIHFTGKKKPWHKRSQWPHRHLKSFYENALAGTNWSGFCQKASIKDEILSFGSYYLTAITKRAKIATTQKYFSQV